MVNEEIYYMSCVSDDIYIYMILSMNLYMLASIEIMKGI